jgi:hypothetical protein
MAEKTADKDVLAEAIAADLVPAPPPELAWQAVQAMHRAPDSGAWHGRLRARRAWPVGAALALGVAIGALAMGWTERSPSAGAVAAGDQRPSAKETIRLGSRAVLVAEAGADLRWRPGPEEGVLVEQNAGTVFYRVNAGAFVVETPVGLVRVQGTCFRVEVTDMKLMHRPNLSGAVLGAALSAAVLVSVYEGRVLLARGSEQVVLGPGESGQLTAAGRPERQPPSASREGSARGERTSLPRFQDTEALRARITEQEKELAELRAMIPVARKVADGSKEERILDPTREELLARAQRCEVAYDTPPINGFDEKTGQRLGLHETEREAMNEAMKELKTQVFGELRKLYVEMGGDPATADRLSPVSMESEIFARAPEGSRSRARQQLAREKAGLVAPPSDLAQTPVAERTMRLMVTIGDQFEKKLAERLGPERARALRAREDGWSGKTVFNGCERAP